MKTILIMGAGASEVPAIRKAKEMGLRVIIVDRNENAPGFNEDGIIKEVNSIADKDKILEIAKKYNINGLVTFVDSGVRSVAYVAKQLGLVGLSEESAYLGTNKIEMRKRLKERGIPVPEFYFAKDKESYLEAISKFPSNCVVKAPDSAGSRGIYLINDVTNKEDVEYAFNYSMKYSGTGEILIEEYMKGLEICVETLSSEGVCYPIQITDQLHKFPPYFTDCGYSQPSMLNEEIKNHIKQLAIDANLALGNINGSSCTEMIITKDGPKIVELGLRLAGDFMTTLMVPLSTGVNMSEAVIKIALGEHIDIHPTIDKGSCVRYFMKERVGIIKDIVGVEEARQLPGIQEVGILKGVGEEATSLRKSSDRLGYVIAQGKSAEDAIEITEKALDMIDFVIE